MRGILISLVISAALWIGVALLADYACAWLEATAVSPLVIALIASLIAMATSAAAAAMWILSTYIDDDEPLGEDAAAALRPWSME